MSVSEAHKKASAKWNNARDSITIRPTKEQGSEIRVAAAAAGMSIQQFLLAAVSEYMKNNDC